MAYIYIYISNGSSQQNYYFWSNNYEISYVEYSVISYFLPLAGENIFLSTEFSNTVSVSSSLNMKDQYSQPQKITRNITFLYLRILIPTFQQINRREKILNRIVEKIPELNCPYFFLQTMFACLCHYEILELCFTFTMFVGYLYIVILSYVLKFISCEVNSYI
jgi:hypothetical protein